MRLCRHFVGGEQRTQVAAEPAGEGAFAVDGPGEHGAVIGLLDQTGELGGVARVELAGGNGFVEELLCFGTNGAELRQCDGVEVGIGEVDLQVGETIGDCFGCRGEARAVGVKLDQGFQRGSEFRATSGELLRNGGRSRAACREQQGALGAKTLNQCRGDDTGFPGDLGERELRRAEALHDASGGGEDLLVGGLAWSRAHAQF